MTPTTPVIVAIASIDAVRLYVRDRSGALSQTGQLTGSMDPAPLAAFAADLADQLGWLPATTAKATPKALPAVKRKRQPPRRTRADVLAYRKKVLRQVEETPGSTTPRIILGVHGERTKEADNAVRAALDYWARQGAVRNEGKGSGAPFRWYPAT